MSPQTLTGYISQQNISSLKLVNGSYHQHWWTSWLSSLLSGPGHNIGHWSLVTDILTLSSWNHPKYRIEQTRTGNWIWWHTPKHFGLLDIASISIVDKDNLIFARHGLFKIISNCHFKLLARFCWPLCVFVYFSLSTNICCWEGDNIKSRLIQNSHSPSPSIRNKRFGEKLFWWGDCFVWLWL